MTGLTVLLDSLAEVAPGVVTITKVLLVQEVWGPVFLVALVEEVRTGEQQPKQTMHNHTEEQEEMVLFQMEDFQLLVV